MHYSYCCDHLWIKVIIYYQVNIIFVSFPILEKKKLQQSYAAATKSLDSSMLSAQSVFLLLVYFSYE